ncbi:uncharacterized protein M421DRAFT_378247 [Didymella exigua CBS 183.55]|uniref:BZIP domain-containing protein n=1 Tax=Didymella exigua CBS 183.55 TaxID=1150837 RepID=A0A6A5RZD2_9PLEO|nr:uncharacterized protein M421DRAFT_378247 [Didymella exigua CBS 183.55]KAF1930617.1 hypothetical protein M421DRAFT_378247 [Didymella exigua CBS 183.55]
MAPSTSAICSTSPASSSDASLPRRKQRVSAEHTLNRVRENQRRHRARQRDHVVSLELRLAEIERQLAKAHTEIEALKAERDTATAFACYDITKHFERMDSAVGTSTSLTQLLDTAAVDVGLDMPAPSSVAESTLIATSFQLLPPPVSPVVGPPPCCTDSLLTPSALTEPTTAAVIPTVGSDPECSTCKTRPPPSPSESTTLCAQAFIMISQQNVRNVDPDLIRMWLSQGYRRAMRKGEGCRVENGTLRGLLEYISEV